MLVSCSRERRAERIDISSSSRRRHGTADLDPVTLKFNQEKNQANKSLDDEDNRTANERVFRSLPELRYQYYVINAAGVFFAILAIQALIFEK